MTLHELIEQNANLTLWCVHVLGPDDVLAAASHEKAVSLARDMNHAVFANIAYRKEKNDILCFAYAAPWPYSPESHASDLLKATGEPV